MRVRKRISKRVNSRQRNRIQKKVSEHHRKSRKLAKQNPQWKSKKPKDLGIPNAFPFKEQILAEREEVRRRRQEEKEKKRKGGVEERVAENNGVSTFSGETEENGYVAGLQVDSDNEDIMDEEIESEEDEGESDEETGSDDEDDDEDEEMDDMESSESEWEGIESEEETSEIEVLTEINTSRNSSQPPFMKAINRSDLVVFVLDARAPDASRSVELEQYAEKKGKSSIFVLNRAELIPPETLQAWVDLLGASNPTYPLVSDASVFKHPTTSSQSITTLKSAILKKPGTSCLIGLPLIGKSTIFNLLRGTEKRLRPTTTLQSSSLTPKSTLIDTPGFTLPVEPYHALLGLTKPTVETIQHLLRFLNILPPEYYTQVEKLYEIPALVRPIEGNRYVNPAKDLLVHVARKFGLMGKNGPHLDSAAQIVCEDCLKGKIQWWIEPVKE